MSKLTWKDELEPRMENLLNSSGYDILIILVTAHLLGDFIFQTEKLIKNKKKPLYFIIHISIITILSYVLPGAWRLWYIPLLILLTHALTDFIKLKFEKNNESKSIRYFFWDQGIHLTVIVLLTFWAASEGSVRLYWPELFGPLFIKLCILLSGLILVLKVSGIIIGMMVKPLIKKMDKPRDSKKKKSSNKGIVGGGEIIGLLERLLIFFFVLNGIWSGIGFLVAAKSIFRFGELKDRENRIEAEYILIGTLYSFSFGIFFSWLTGFALSIT